MADKAKQYYYGVGRRKEASASARLFSGKGQVTVNGKLSAEYFGYEELSNRLLQPLEAVSKEGAYDVTIKVSGGGKSGQADASRLAIAKALTALSQDLRPTLKKAGLMKRDSRIKERKKYGLKRARKAPQFTKR